MPGSGDIPAAEASGLRFVGALVRQDWTAVEACFAADVEFRALVPSGWREAGDSASAVAQVRQWFEDSHQLLLLSADVEQVQDRTALRYRLQIYKDRWYVLEQRAYFDAADGRIQCIDLLCSGFRPVWDD